MLYSYIRIFTQRFIVVIEDTRCFRDIHIRIEFLGIKFNQKMKWKNIEVLNCHNIRVIVKHLMGESNKYSF